MVDRQPVLVGSKLFRGTDAFMRSWFPVAVEQSRRLLTFAAPRVCWHELTAASSGNSNATRATGFSDCLARFDPRDVAEVTPDGFCISYKGSTKGHMSTRLAANTQAETNYNVIVVGGNFTEKYSTGSPWPMVGELFICPAEAVLKKRRGGVFLSKASFQILVCLFVSCIFASPRSCERCFQIRMRHVFCKRQVVE